MNATETNPYAAAMRGKTPAQLAAIVARATANRDLSRAARYAIEDAARAEDTRQRLILGECF